MNPMCRLHAPSITSSRGRFPRRPVRRGRELAARPFGQIGPMLDFQPRFTLLDALERID
jgi:hypothetical protein